jgi:outer membrane protein TolC
VREAKANTRAGEAAAQIDRARVSFDLKSNFEGLIYAQEYTALTEEIIKRRQENLRLVQLRFESGHENKGSVLLSQSYLSQAQFDNLQAKNIRRSTAADFARTLGLDPEQDLSVNGGVPTAEPKDPGDLRALALTTPAYEQASAQENSADAGITVAKSGYFPSLDLTATYGRNDTVFFPATPERWSTTLTLSIPIFSGGRDLYASRAATASWESSALKVENTRRSVTANLTETYAAYEEAASKLKVDVGFRDAALVRAEIARTKYNNGLLTFDDWDTIENDLITRQKAFLQSKRARVTAEAAWEQAQGKGVIP